jgi:ADP-ribose pyrophosphatase
MAFEELGREKKYQGHAFDIAKVHVRLPDGRQRDYDLVEHGDSVTILPLDDDGNLYFVSQYRLGSGRTLLELPAGVLDPGESPLISAQRELREEIGKDARKFIKLGGFYLAPGYSDEYMTVFLATDLFDAPLAGDEDEFINLECLSIKEAYQKARAGDIHDGKTLAALTLARSHLAESS